MPRTRPFGQLQIARGTTIETLPRFRKCCEEMQAVVDFDETPEKELPSPLATIRDQAILDFRNGETSEFI